MEPNKARVQRKIQTVGASLYVPAAELTLEDQRSIRPNQHCTSSSTSRRPRRSLSVDSDVSTEDDGVSSVPRRRLDPVNGVEEGGSRTVAGVLGVDTLNVGVAVGLEEVHEDGLDRLGLVDDGLGTDVDSTDRLGVDVVLGEETRNSYISHIRRREKQMKERGKEERLVSFLLLLKSQNGKLTVEGKGVDVLVVTDKGHVLIAETDGVSSFRHAVVLFEVLVRDGLARESKERREPVSS
jgi:hypothetical protein